MSESGSAPRRVGWSSFVGTTIEYYDFLLYGAAAAVVFNRVFFPSLDPLLGTVASLATLAAGWFARLVGGLLFAHHGDLRGRRPVLVATLMVMGVASGLIGLLPTYEQIGPAAGVLLVLLRVVQGLAVGGEYGGAVLMTVEHAPPGRRALAASAVSMGAPAGSALATGAIALVTLLPEPALLTWGWRLPFVASFGLVAVGLYLRLRVPESPAFRPAGDRPADPPLVALLRTDRRRVLWGTLVAVGPFCGQGVLYFFVTAYATGVGHSRSAALAAVTLATVLTVATTPVAALLADRFGRRPVVTYGALATAALAFPHFWLIGTGSPALLVLALCLYTPLVMVAGVTVLPVLLSELFPTGVRYTGMSLTYQVAQMVGSGFSPMIAAALIATVGGGTSAAPAAAFVVVLALGSALAVRRLPETGDAGLPGSPAAVQRRSHDRVTPVA